MWFGSWFGNPGTGSGTVVYDLILAEIEDLNLVTEIEEIQITAEIEDSSLGIFIDSEIELLIEENSVDAEINDDRIC